MDHKVSRIVVASFLLGSLCLPLAAILPVGAQSQNFGAKVLSVKSTARGKELIFDSTADLGVLTVMNRQGKKIGATIYLNRPQVVSLLPGCTVHLLLGEAIKQQPNLLKFFPSEVVSGIDLNGISSPTPTKAKPLLAVAARFSELKDLSVAGTDLGDADIHLIAQFKSLEKLCVSYTNLTGPVIATLPSLPKWKAIDANRIKAVKALIRKFPQARMLNDVRVVSKDLDNSDLRIISSLSAVEFLEISRMHLDDSSLALLAKFQKLKYLAVRYCHFEGNSIEKLARLKGLKELYVSKDMVYRYPFLSRSHGAARNWTLAF